MGIAYIVLLQTSIVFAETYASPPRCTKFVGLQTSKTSIDRISCQGRVSVRSYASMINPLRQTRILDLDPCTTYQRPIPANTLLAKGSQEQTKSAADDESKLHKLYAGSLINLTFYRECLAYIGPCIYGPQLSGRTLRQAHGLCNCLKCPN